MTVAELIEQLSKVDPGLPVLAYYKPSGGYAEAEMSIINAGQPRPYVIIATA